MPDIKQYDARPGKGFIQYTVRWREPGMQQVIDA